MRVSYDRAVEHFDTLVEAAAVQAKVVTTSRTQHFESQHQVKTALQERAEHLPGRRIGRLAGFDKPQVRSFLAKRYGDEALADARLALIEDVRDLFGLAANPRMLGFIADLPEDQLRQAKERSGEITAASLYELLIERWLVHEHERAKPRGAPGFSLPDLWEGITQLALRLWQQTEPSVLCSDLHDEAASLIPRIGVQELDAATTAHQLGSGTLLVRDEEGRFRFIHQSVMEWLVASRAAETLTSGGEATALLGRRALSPLMADFLVALTVDRGTAPRDWVRDALEVAEGEVVKKNALMINERLGDPVRLASRTYTDQAYALMVDKRLGDPVRLGANLAGQDLRGQDLSGRDLAGADLRGADLRDTRLAGAHLTGARLTGARLAGTDLSRARLRDADLEAADGAGASLLGADLSGARLRGSRWPRAKLVAARLDIQALTDCAMWGAARPGADRPDLQNAFADPCTSVAWHPTHQILVTGHQSGGVRLWDLDSGEALRTLEGHEHWVLSVAFSPDGKCLASGSADNTVRLWDPESGRALHTLEGHEYGVRSVAFSPHGKCLASGSDDKTVRLWDLDSGEALRTLEGHKHWVLSVAFSPDGKCLASGSEDQTVRLWDPESRMLLATLICAPEGWAAVTPDGRYKLGGDTAGAWFAINLCRFEPGELDPYLPERLRRLAPEERIL